GEFFFVRIHSLFSALVDHTLRIRHQDIFAPYSQAEVKVRAGNRRRPSPTKHNPDLGNLFSSQLKRIEKCHSANHRRPMLVVVKNRNLESLAEFFFDLKTLGSFDVLEIDSAEGGLQHFTSAD